MSTWIDIKIKKLCSVVLLERTVYSANSTIVVCSLCLQNIGHGKGTTHLGITGMKKTWLCTKETVWQQKTFTPPSKQSFLLGMLMHPFLLPNQGHIASIFYLDKFIPLYPPPYNLVEFIFYNNIFIRLSVHYKAKEWSNVRPGTRCHVVMTRFT